MIPPSRLSLSLSLSLSRVDNIIFINFNNNMAAVLLFYSLHTVQQHNNVIKKEVFICILIVII